MASRASLSSTISLLLLASLAGCGGGGSGGGSASSAPTIVPPVKGLSTSVLTQNLGATTKGSTYTMPIQHGVLVNTDATNTATAETGKVTAGFVPEGEGDPYLDIALGNRSQYNVFNPDLPGMDGKASATGKVKIGNATALYGSYADGNSVVYLPADTRQKLYVGMTGQTLGADFHSYAVFGSKTAEGALTAQQGSASYTGKTEAVLTEDAAAVRLTGNATTSVDFGGRSISGRTVLKGARHDGTTLRVGVDYDGTFAGGNKIAGTMKASGVPTESGTMTGAVAGSFYGPDAENLGITLRGTGRNVGTDVLLGGASIQGRK